MKKIILLVTLAILAIGAFFGYKFYSKNYANNVSKEGYILIPRKANFNTILDSVSPYLKDKQAFIDVAKSKNLDRYFNAGRYKIKKGTGNSDLVNMIKAGNQTENTFRIGDFYTVYQMIGKVTKKTEQDSLQFATELNKIAVQKGAANAEGLKKYFFIDTYNFFWTVTPQDFFKKFETDYNKFWNAERIAKEKSSGLSRDQIYALASIVYKETGGKPDEMKRVAGLYLNRYRKGMKLQSDPTVIYTVLQTSNFTQEPLKRVLYKHLAIPSPYNTYAVAGIPPGPICMVDKNSVDAVLNAEKNDFLYMVADPQRLGYHKFTASDAEHAINAKAYQQWLNSKNIK